jgi:hypothetical protein
VAEILFVETRRQVELVQILNTENARKERKVDINI